MGEQNVDKNYANSMSTQILPNETPIQMANKNVLVMDQSEIDQGDRHLAELIAIGKDGQIAANNAGSAFLMLNVDTLVHLFDQWQRNMPRVKPYYAVKCNNDPVLIATLAALGTGFDCASRQEIDLILKNGFGQPEDIIYAHPCKTARFIRHAENCGVNRFTFDCEEELEKVKKNHPNPKMVLRIDVTDPGAVRRLELKFGCDPVNDAAKLLKVAKEMDMDVIGISFHVGSGCKNPLVYREAIAHAKRLFILGRELGHRMHLLDVGGGFIGSHEHEGFFKELSKVICEALDDFFPAQNQSAGSSISTDSGQEMGDEDGQIVEEVEIIAEPGRYFAGPPISVCANIIGATRLDEATRQNGQKGDKEIFMYFLDDGIYGTFSCIPSRLFIKPPNGIPLFVKPGQEEQKFLSIIRGPTNDPGDIVEQICLKSRLQISDWLFYPDMGAYSVATATEFNGFTRPKETRYVVGNKTWETLKNLFPTNKDE